MWHERIFANIDLDALYQNAASLLSVIGEDARMLAVIKSDAYGHGALQCARTLSDLPGLYGFAVATPEEAVALTDDGIRCPILLLGIAFEETVDELISRDVILTVSSPREAMRIADAAKRVGKKAKIWIATDTGMGRIGFPVTDHAAMQILSIKQDDMLCIEGVFSHLATADEVSKEGTQNQIALFDQWLDMLGSYDVHPPMRSLANSAATLLYPDARYDVVRVGIMLYGLPPSDYVKEQMNAKGLRLRPVMSVGSHVTLVKEVKAGAAISYGGTFVAPSDMMIATIPCGYADGYPRSISNCGEVLIHGRRAAICGRVCMDMFMVDVTDIPDVCPGDEVILVGKQGEDEITMEDVAAWSGRFHYEIPCLMGKRMPLMFSGGHPYH